MHTILAVFGLGGGEIVIVMVVALVLFGANKIPVFAKGLGQALKEFKKASADVSNELNNAMNQETPPPPPHYPAPTYQPKQLEAPEHNAPTSTVPKT